MTFFHVTSGKIRSVKWFVSRLGMLIFFDYELRKHVEKIKTKRKKTYLLFIPVIPI